MSKTWQFLKEHADWLYAFAFIGLAVDSALASDWTAFWIVTGIGAFTLLVMAWMRAENTVVEVTSKGGTITHPRTFEEGEMKALLSKGYEPVETPYEDPVNEHARDCSICRAFFKESP